MSEKDIGGDLGVGFGRVCVCVCVCVVRTRLVEESGYIVFLK